MEVEIFGICLCLLCVCYVIVYVTMKNTIKNKIGKKKKTNLPDKAETKQPDPGLLSCASSRSLVSCCIYYISTCVFKFFFFSGERCSIFDALFILAIYETF